MLSRRCCGNVTDGGTNHVYSHDRQGKRLERTRPAAGCSWWWLADAGRQERSADRVARGRWLRSRDGPHAVHAAIAHDHRLALDTERESPAADGHVRAHLRREGHAAPGGA